MALNDVLDFTWKYLDIIHSKHFSFTVFYFVALIIIFSRYRFTKYINLMLTLFSMSNPSTAFNANASWCIDEDTF